MRSKLTVKLYNFSRNRDKLDFLKILRQESVTDLEKHKQKCSRVNCNFESSRKTGIWLIDQEVDSINKYYCFETISEDAFSVEEESSLHCKLNDIVEKLQNLGYGQEIIFS